jgi:hypothetical protein
VLGFVALSSASPALQYAASAFTRRLDTLDKKSPVAIFVPVSCRFEDILVQFSMTYGTAMRVGDETVNAHR